MSYVHVSELSCRSKSLYVDIALLGVHGLDKLWLGDVWLVCIIVHATSNSK